MASEERLALFIDGANLYAASKAIGIDIDYRKLLDAFKDRGRLLRAFYYTVLLDDLEYSALRPLIDWLAYNGFSVVTKQGREYIDASGRRRFRGSMAIELAVDAMQMAESIDHMVLFSGDGDYRALIDAVQRKGVRVSVVSTLRTQSATVADDLRRQADEFLDLVDLMPMIGRETEQVSKLADIAHAAPGRQRLAARVITPC